MTTYPIYQVDAFVGTGCEGNPAAVVIADVFPDENTMQKIAAENNLAETAFVCSLEKGYEIRWFTPTVEVDLCGHATLAAAYVIFGFYQPDLTTIEFLSPRSGKLGVEIQEDKLELVFPTDKAEVAIIDSYIFEALGAHPASVYKGKDDYLLVFDSERTIKEMDPDFRILSEVDARGVIVTSHGEEVDFVSRFFAPQSGIDEDPVTGSAHTLLTPFWSKRLGKQELKARQLSKRGGELFCRMDGSNVRIAGKARLYMKGEIYI